MSTQHPTTLRSFLALALALGAATTSAPRARAQEASPPAATTAEAPATTAEAPDTVAEAPATTAEPPPAEPTATPTDDFRNAWVSLGARAGLYVPGIVNRMDPHVLVGIDLAVLLPFLERRLAVQAEVGWAPPGAGVAATEDPRLGAPGSMSTWTASMTTDELFVGGGLLFRFLPPGEIFVPYLGVSGRLYFLRTITWGVGAGEPFGENSEVSMQGGLGVNLGGEVRLGPGALVIDVGFGWSELPHTITGPTSTSAISAQLGYRFFF
jgi:hypothetical protein